MNRQNADLPFLEGQPVLPAVPSGKAIDLSANDLTDQSDIEELLDYRSVPRRPGPTVLVQVRQGRRLKPLPYELEEDDS
ncbi:MAG: hypothetical protein ACP5XB_07730 [Isosphaeraceae bacterium]